MADQHSTPETRASKRRLPPGMYQRNRTYYAKLNHHGRRIRKRLSTDFRVACQLLNDLRARFDKGDFGILDNDYAWQDLKAEFLRWAKQSIRNPQDYARDLKRFENYSLPRVVQDVTPDRIYAFRQWRLDQGVTPRTVNREVSTIGNMLNKGVVWQRIAANPIASVAPLTHVEMAKERRSLTLPEVQALFAASPKHLVPVWRMFMCTGIRKSELVSLQFSDIDLERRTITIRPSVAKSKRAREIPLDDEMVTMLDELADLAEHRETVPGGTRQQTEQQKANFTRQHVFVTKANTPFRNNLLRAFYAVCRKAGIDDAHRHGSVDIHSLRVSFATLSLQHGANPKDVQAILGHSTLAMTMNVYGRATDSGKRSAVNALPFATASGPSHVMPMLRTEGAQKGAQVLETCTKPRKNRGKIA